MNSAELVQAGRLEEGLAALQTEIRNKPGDNRLRVFLFQLDCVLGRLDKALTQLQSSPASTRRRCCMAQIFRPVIACELLRREVFTGKRTPIIFGEPMEWMGLLVQANELVARGEFAAAAESRGRGFRGRAGLGGQDQWRTLRVDCRRGFAPRPDAGGDHRRQVLLGAILPHSEDHDRETQRSAGPGVAAGAIHLDQWRDRAGPHSDALFWHGGIDRRSVAAGAQERSGFSGLAKPTSVWGSAFWPPTPMSTRCWDAGVLS